MKYTDKQIIDALTATGGYICKAADILGCCYQTVSARIKADSSLVKKLEHIIENRLDVAEDILITTMEGKDPKLALNASQFYLRYRGRGRGYIKHEKFEITENLSIMMRDADERTR